MLIRFSVANYLSFKKLTDFNMVSGDVRTKKNHIDVYKGIEILKFSLLYGANGAGKSNLIRSVEALSNLVKEEKIKDLSQESHKLDPECENKPTIFEIEFTTDSGKAFIYGISIQNDLVQNEYLYFSGLDKSKDKLIFERKLIDGNKSEFELEKKYLKLKKDRAFIDLFGSSIIESNEIALSKFLDFEDLLIEFNEVIDEVYSWLTYDVRIIHPESKPTYLLFNLSSHEEFLNFSNDLLRNIDVGIKALHIETFSLREFFGEDDEGKKSIKKLKEILTEESFTPLSFDVIAVREGPSNEEGEYFIKKLVIEHSGKNKDLYFSLYEESDGTRRIIEYLSLVYEILSPEFKGIYLVDEIERSIHPYLLKELLRKLVSADTITGQLVFTTHEANLLDLDLFRQDEIWLTEKSPEGSTCFSALSDFKIRNDLDIRKGYLKGRFGAVPMLANLKDLNWYKYASS